MIYKFYKLCLVALCCFVFAGCGEKPQPQGRIKIKKIKKPEPEVVEEVQEPLYVYKGGQYRTPFSQAGKSEGSSKYVPGADVKISVNPDSLKVTGVFEDKKEKYAILSGIGDFYIVKKGRLYNEDEREVPNMAAVIKKDKVILITGENAIYELPIPE